MQFNQTYQWAKKLHDHKIQQLSASGCTCHSTYLSINGTSKSSYLYLMGVYHFEGMFEVRNNPWIIYWFFTYVILTSQEKPYYQQVTRPGNPDNRQGFLYWDKSTNMWKVGPTLGGTNMLFRTAGFTKPHCPGDANNLKNWQYSGTLSWKNDPLLSIECLQV